MKSTYKWFEAAPWLPVVVYAIVFLLIIQSAGTLVESVYILDLLNSRLDEKAAGVLFFFLPFLPMLFAGKYPRGTAWLLAALLLIARGLIPAVSPAGRVLAAGIAAAAALGLLFVLMLNENAKDGGAPRTALWGSGGLALGVALSTLLRTVYYGVEYSLTPAGSWVGWLLGAVLAVLIAQWNFAVRPRPAPEKPAGTTAPLLGLYLAVILVYFVFSAPAVIARWTEGSYPLIVSAVSLFSLGWAGLALYRPGWLERLSPRLLLGWNAAFTLSLVGTILAHRVPFPPTLTSPEVVVRAPTPLQQLPLALMLLLFPVIFADMRVFLKQIEAASPAPHRLVPGILLGGGALILLVFAHIFTNVWGYIEPVSPPFRNAFWLPHFLLAGGLCLLAWRAQPFGPALRARPIPAAGWAWGAGFGAILLATALSALPGPRVQAERPPGSNSLVAMTYNTQQFNDENGEKAFERQLALILRASPDILVLQETDSNRISLNNNDYVRYFAERLGYHSYYGPTPVTGTYGTAILSRYPLENTRSVFIYSDKDETGVAEAEVVIDGRRFTIYNVHPDSSDPAMLVFAQTLLARSKDQSNVIAMGDYNLRDYEEAYQLIDSVLVNAWTSVYPSKIGADGLDMSGKNRIDHIFISPNLKARNPVYVLPPESATDHPIHWSEIVWEEQ